MILLKEAKVAARVSPLENSTEPLDGTRARGGYSRCDLAD